MKINLRVVGEAPREIEFEQGAQLDMVFDRADTYACSAVINGERTPIDGSFALLNGLTIEATPRVKAA